MIAALRLFLQFSANKGAPATNNSSLFDDFDPFLAPTSSTHASPSKQHLDMEHHQESTSPDANGFADAFDPLASGHDGQHDKQHHDEVCVYVCVAFILTSTLPVMTSVLSLANQLLCQITLKWLTGF